jgi:hypothetical protein
VRVYHNTLVDTVASFERTERSAVGDHFGWHPATGPDVDHRQGHVFAGNLLVADESYSLPLLRFEQPKALCERLSRPQVKELDGNVYVRRGEAASGPLIVWSPAAGESCQAEVGSLENLRKLVPGLEAHGQYVNGYYGSVLKSQELGRYELIRGPWTAPAESLPVEIRRLLGWQESDARTPGAFPITR